MKTTIPDNAMLWLNDVKLSTGLSIARVIKKQLPKDAEFDDVGYDFRHDVNLYACSCPSCGLQLIRFKPTTFTQLTRINSIGGISIEPEQIDASALEDLITRYIKGRADTGGSFAVTVNYTDETAEEWATLIAAYQALSGGKRMWIETIVPDIEKAFFVVAQPPEQIPQPEIGQNELLTVEMNLTIEEYKGADTKVAFTGE